MVAQLNLFYPTTQGDEDSVKGDSAKRKIQMIKWTLSNQKFWLKTFIELQKPVAVAPMVWDAMKVQDIDTTAGRRRSQDCVPHTCHTYFGMSKGKQSSNKRTMVNNKFDRITKCLLTYFFLLVGFLTQFFITWITATPLYIIHMDLFSLI